jgi:hypothetical protein
MKWFGSTITVNGEDLDVGEDLSRDRHGGRSRKKKGILHSGLDSAWSWIQPLSLRTKAPPDSCEEAALAAMLPPQTVEVDLGQTMRALAAIATALWRIRTKLEAEPAAVLPSELRHLPRHIQAAWDALAAGHIEVRDPKGQRYVPGMAVIPIAFQPTDGVGVEVIIETIKPSVFFKDILIQRADVIVAQPIKADMPEAVDDTTPATDRIPDTKQEDLGR